MCCEQGVPNSAWHRTGSHRGSVAWPNSMATMVEHSMGGAGVLPTPPDGSKWRVRDSHKSSGPLRGEGRRDGRPMIALRPAAAWHWGRGGQGVRE